MRYRNRHITTLTLAFVATCLAAQVRSQTLQRVKSSATARTYLANAAERRNWVEVEKQILRAGSLDQSQADGMTAIHWAAFHNNPKIVKRLLNAGALVDPKTDYGLTPLVIACQSGHAEVAKVLIQSNADVNHEIAGGETVLMTAARTGNVEIVRTLIELGAAVNETERRGQTALMWAAAEGNLAVVDELIKSKADIDKSLKTGFTALLFACREGKSECAQRLIEAGADVNAPMNPQNGKGRNPRHGMAALMMAVESGHFELAIKLVELGADPNDQRSQYAPLHAITWVRKTKVGDDPSGDPPPRGSGEMHSLQFVEKIVKLGADVNLQTEKGWGGRAYMHTKGATPFLMASRTADLPLMKLLLKLGADPTITNIEKCTPLLAAAGVGVRAVGEEPGTVEEVAQAIKLLHELGADVNAVDDNGETAMHGAAYRNYPETVKLLASLGADANVWNQENKWKATPVQVAQGKRPGSLKPSPETIAALKEAMKQ